MWILNLEDLYDNGDYKVEDFYVVTSLLVLTFVFGDLVYLNSVRRLVVNYGGGYFKTF